VLSDQVPYFILDLLQQTPTVYVKGLGRFEAIFHPAVMDVPGARIKPPYIQPEFNQQELQADTLLTTYIHCVNGMDKEEIEKAIEQFVQKVEDSVDRNDHYTLDQFGSFSKATGGGLRFTPDWDSFNLSFNGLEVIDLRPPVEPVETKHYVVEPFEPEPSVSFDSAPEDVQPVKVAPTPVFSTPEFVAPHPRDTSAIDENTSRLWWTILASALVLITVLCAYLAWDILSNRQKLTDLVVMRPDTTKKEIILPTPPVVDTTPVQENPVTPADTGEVASPVTTPQENQVPDESFCYVIVGAFKDAANIAKMEERVTSMGYEVERITGGALTRVAIKSSCDKQILQQTLNDARAKLNPEAWLY
jgi:hypothetical protein